MKLIMDNPNKLKFTKIRPYRINFKYDGTQYSLNEFDDGCFQVIALVNRDIGERVSSDYGYMDINIFIENATRKRNIIYSRINKKEFLKSLASNDFISKTEEHKREDREKRKVELGVRILEYKNNIEKLELELKELEEGEYE